MEHYLLALQLILRKQVSWLITVAKLPAALEVRYLPNPNPMSTVHQGLKNVLVLDNPNVERKRLPDLF